jgi:probable HAF family extracellular repeat protein
MIFKSDGVNGMSQRLCRKFILVLLGALAIAVGITFFNTTHATTTFYYAVTELESLSTKESGAYGINNSGQVVGYSYPSGGPMHAVLWDNDALIDVSRGGPFPLNYASAINKTGQVVCNLSPTSHVSGRCPYLWQDGNITYIGECGGSSYVNAINNAGQVAGSSVNSPFVWQDGVMTPLTTLGSNNHYSGALGINDRGQVVGFAATKSDNQSHAVLWQNNTIEDLGTLPGGSYSQASSINELGKVVGWSNTSSGSTHAVFWQKRQIKDLGTFDGNDTKATAINNRGTVVGYSFNSYDTPIHAFVGRNGRMRDLNSLLPANSGWELTAAYGINDRGQIVGKGKKDGQTKAYLLTPTWVTN